MRAPPDLVAPVATQFVVVAHDIAPVAVEDDPRLTTPDGTFREVHVTPFVVV